MENLNLPKEITEAVTAHMPRDRERRHPTAKLIKEAIAEDLMIRKLEELTGTLVDEELDMEESFIGFPSPCPHNAHVNLIDRLRLVSYNGSIFEFRDVIVWEGVDENLLRLTNLRNHEHKKGNPKSASKLDNFDPQFV